MVLSSLSVYIDAEGRSLDEADSEATFPRYPVPVTEDQPTLAPAGTTYSKRALDRRPFVALAFRGESRFQPTSTANLAEAVYRAAQRPGRRALNLTDPQAPTVSEIGRAVVALLDHEWAELLLPGGPVGTVGDTPWSVPRPFVASSERAAAEIGYRPVHSYTEALGEDVPWLVSATAGRDWRDVLPDLVNNYSQDFFDYAAEDSLVARYSHGGA